MFYFFLKFLHMHITNHSLVYLKKYKKLKMAVIVPQYHFVFLIL